MRHLSIHSLVIALNTSSHYCAIHEDCPMKSPTPRLTSAAEKFICYQPHESAVWNIFECWVQVVDRISTVWRRPSESGLHSQTAAKKPPLREAKMKRNVGAKKHKWFQMLHLRWTTCMCLVPTINHGGGLEKVWWCMWWWGQKLSELDAAQWNKISQQAHIQYDPLDDCWKLFQVSDSLAKLGEYVQSRPLWRVNSLSHYALFTHFYLSQCRE